jgi:hypothetical protein
MDRLKNQKMENFCKLLASEDISPATACYRVGYGKEQHPKQDQYHANMGSRLIKRHDIQERIHTLRLQEANKNKDYKTTLIDLLKRTISFDFGKYYKSSNLTLTDGQTVTTWYLSVPFEEWQQEDRLLLNGFNVKGQPVFLDKQWAFEKMMRLLGMLEKGQSSDVEDLLTDLIKANLPISAPSQFDKEIEKEISDELEG